MKTLNCAPRWAGLLPVLMDMLTNSRWKPEAREIARKELANMAKAADLYNDLTADALKACLVALDRASFRQAGPIPGGVWNIGPMDDSKGGLLDMLQKVKAAAKKAGLLEEP